MANIPAVGCRLGGEGAILIFLPQIRTFSSRASRLSVEPEPDINMAPSATLIAPAPVASESAVKKPARVVAARSQSSSNEKFPLCAAASMPIQRGASTRIAGQTKHFAISPDGEKVACAMDCVLKILDVASLSELAALDAAQKIRHVCFAPSGTFLACVSRCWCVYLCSPCEGPKHPDPPKALSCTTAQHGKCFGF